MAKWENWTGHAGALPDLDGLLDGGDVQAVADAGVGGVEGAVVGPDGLAERDDLVGGGVGGGVTDRPVDRENAPISMASAARRCISRSSSAVAGRSSVAPEAICRAELPTCGATLMLMPLGLEGVGPVVQRVPLPHGVADEGPADVVLQGLGAALACGERRVAAVAGDLGRHALVGLALAAGVVEQGHVGVGVHVDEARAYDVPGGVDAAGRLGVAERADGLDAAVGYAYVAPVAGGVGAVDDGAVEYEDVECHVVLLRIAAMFPHPVRMSRRGCFKPAPTAKRGGRSRRTV